MQKDELKEIYFGFYDKLSEPHRSQAKANWAWGFTKGLAPIEMEEAIGWGFDWEETPEGFNYWLGAYEVKHKQESKVEYWQKVMFAGQQIGILQDMRDAGMMTIEEFKEEVNKLLDGID